MKKIYYLLLILTSTVFSQTITVDDTRTAVNLVDLLITDPCVETSNTSFSSGQSVAYFNQNGSSFPITEGVIIRNGIAINTQGTYNGTNLGTVATGGGLDAFLQNLSNTNGGSGGALVDLAYLEFDFTTYADAFNFNFIFASNEYGEFQCLSRDIVAFELTDLITNTITNIALVPTTSNPVSTATIKDDLYNASCSATNPTFFGVYNVDNPAASTLNMRGHSISMSGSANIIPLNPYRLKLVIGDYISSNYDSAIFISALNFITNFSLGNDATICAGDTYLLDATIDNTYSYQWFLNSSPISGETNPTYTVNQPGIYSVEITKGSCLITDEIIFNSLMVNSPNDISTCDSGGATNIYDLTINNELTLGIDDTIYDIFYFETPADITANNFIPIADLTNYSGANGQTIYIKILNTTTGNYCDAIYTFNLTEIANIIAGITTPGATCEDQLNYDLSTHDAEVENGQVGTTITYYNSQTDAIAGVGSIGNIGTIPPGVTTYTFWFRIEDTSNTNCFDVTSVVITINPLPTVDTVADVQECHSYTLPIITNGTYYLLPGGPTTPGQVQLNAGDIIDQGGTYFIYVGPDANGCTNESNFELYFVDEYVPILDNCGQFIVPSPPYGIGEFYTDLGGPSGTGTLIPVGTIYTNNTQSSIIQTIYYYAEVPVGTPCRDERFDINIHPIPLVDDPIDETRCNSYTLPALTNGMYYSEAGGTGTNYPVGHIITASETIYVYNTSPYLDVNGNPQVCDDQNPFQVNIIDPNIFGDVFACETYTLPALTFGGYFDAPNGGGNPINQADPITTSQVVYFYANVTDASNCADFLNYNITIYPQVPVSTLDNGNYCGEYILPHLDNGTYYALPGGPGPIMPYQTPLNEGDIINLTDGLTPGTYYIYNEITHNNGNGTSTTCYSEDDFTVIISPFPDLYQYAYSRPECEPYYLATPAVGAYYTEPDGPNGTGVLVDPDVEHTTTETFYFYFEDPTSGCRVDKRFQILFNGVNLPEINDIVACTSTKLNQDLIDLLDHLPPEGAESLYHIEYHFDDPNGAVIDPNTYVFNSTNTATPQTVCLYAVNNDGFLINCPDEQYFTVSILEKPVLPSYAALDNKNYCETYTLPALPATPVVTTGTYTVNYYSQPGGNAADLINPANYTFTTPDDSPRTYDIWVFAQTTIDGVFKCTDEKHFQFTVYPLLDLVIEGGIICVNALTGITEQPVLLNSGLNPVDFTVEWYLNGTLMGTGPTYLATQEGTYDVVTIKLTPDNPPNCNYNPTTVIVGKSSPAIATISVSEPFENVAVITINVDTGFGVYEFQLDDGDFQTSNQFINVSSGFHTVVVRDVLNFCGDFILSASVIKYPKFFTPNSDGYNETWNIKDLITDHPESIISIFDRYGKLIKQISPSGIGWDGTYNNQKLPSTDYWFTVNYIHEGQEKIFRAHFTLKR
jgi:gliding motility-associated-like protein